MKKIYEEINRIIKDNECAALATLISVSGSTPRHQGAKMLVRQDRSILGTIGGGLLEGMVREEAEKIIINGNARIIDFDLTGKDKSGMICGGIAKVYIEPIASSPTLYIFGGGHISFFLERLGKMVGFKVTVIDDRKEYANPIRFPEADETIAGEYEDVFSQLKTDSLSYIVIVTRGHVHDQTVLEWALTTKSAYIGMIGSKSKTKKIYDNLVEKGIKKEKLDCVYAPIGLEINSETPEEIAVSIMAEIIKVKGNGKKQKSSVCPA